MSLSTAEVEHIAELARLRLSPEEIERYRDQLSDILDYAARLGSLDTTDVPPTSSVLSNHGELRPDEPRPGLPTDKLFGNAPDTKDGQFLVPPVLE